MFNNKQLLFIFLMNLFCLHVNGAAECSWLPRPDPVAFQPLVTPKRFKSIFEEVRSALDEENGQSLVDFTFASLIITEMLVGSLEKSRNRAREKHIKNFLKRSQREGVLSFGTKVTNRFGLRPSKRRRFDEQLLVLRQNVNDTLYIKDETGGKQPIIDNYMLPQQFLE